MILAVSEEPFIVPPPLPPKAVVDDSEKQESGTFQKLVQGSSPDC